MSEDFALADLKGLPGVEVAKRQKEEGFNELTSQKSKGWFFVFLKVISEPMLVLLIIAGGIYLFMGAIEDALMLISFVFVVIGITFYQERKTEKTLEALKNLSSPRALVIRDGEQKRITGREVVRGDFVILREGDRIPADGRVLSCENLSVDESLLTGESMPVRKSKWDKGEVEPRPGGDDLPFAYSGSMVVSGRGILEVLSIGGNTEIGKIGKSLETIKDEETLLRKETAKIVRYVAGASVILCIIVVLAYIFIKGNVIGGFLAGLTLAMAMLPEEFPVVLLIFLTLGSWRISKRKVLTRRPAVIETLGAATVLCTDKTGTLTLNKMELGCLYVSGTLLEIKKETKEIPEKFNKLLEYGILASQKDPFDPIEKELNRAGKLFLNNFKNFEDGWNLVREYPLSKELLALSHVWQSKDGANYAILSKGAPEAILDLCHSSEIEKKEILEKVKEMSDRGYRVLGSARAEFLHSNNLPNNQHDFEFKFVGLFGFIDPARDTVPEAVKEAYMAGMRIIVITGDYPGTAQFIAKKIGIKNCEEYITGEELSKMSQDILKEKIKTVNIFARVVPEQKLLIVNALKENGEIVAMTGDGVNDAPALKSAHIGIAMGERGTDVAREASSLVLLDDDFSSIVSAVRLGRRIYDNLKKAMGYILSVHVPIAGMSLLPLLFDYPVVLLPAHIAFLELIIDPSCSVVFESVKEEEDIMQRPPRSIKQPIFGLKNVSINLLQGVAVLIATFLLFVFAIKTGRSELEARSIAFVALVLSNIALITVNMSWKHNVYEILKSVNRTFVMVCLGAVACLLVVLYVPFFSTLLHLAPIGLPDLVLIICVVVLSLSWFEILKLFNKKQQIILK